MKVLEAKFVKQFINLCFEGYQKGWHERNGGNLSYRIKKEEVESIKENFTYQDEREIGTIVKDLSNEYFLVTGSGCYLMNVKEYPEENICISDMFPPLIEVGASRSRILLNPVSTS